LNEGARIGPTGGAAGVGVVEADTAGSEGVGVGSAEGVGVGWSDGVGVGSDGDGEMEGEGDTCALADDPGHSASDTRSVASISAVRMLVAAPRVRSLIALQALSPGITSGERLSNAWRRLSPDADRSDPWRRVLDPAP
jgi:hypothetical protein